MQSCCGLVSRGRFTFYFLGKVGILHIPLIIGFLFLEDARGAEFFEFMPHFCGSAALSVVLSVGTGSKRNS